MKRHTRSILQELQEYSQTTANAKELIIEDRAKHAIAEATDIIQEINSNFDDDVAQDLEKRFIDVFDNHPLTYGWSDGVKKMMSIKLFDEVMKDVSNCKCRKK